MVGAMVKVEGQYRVHRKYRSYGDNVKVIKKPYIIADSIDFITVEEVPDNNNEVILVGTVDGDISIRRTGKSHMDVADITIKVPRDDGEFDYIPAICWNENARAIQAFADGTKLEFHGRCQSRVYSKVYNDLRQYHTVYEISVSSIYTLEEE